MTPDALQDLTAAAAARRIRGGELSPVELTAAVLERIQALEPAAGAFITVTADAAMEAAREAERRRDAGESLGPLHGVPLALKDIIDVAGTPTTAGTRIFRDRPAADATVVRRLRAAGAVIVGKTNLHECAYGVTSVNPHYGPSRNPWDPARISGGSSGGSAVAVAGSMALGALGSDTGGSIRIPAALSGLAGLKPTYGRVSLAGIFPLSWSLDHAGPMARTVEDVALLLEVIAGHDPADIRTAALPVPGYRDGLTGSVRGCRIGVPADALAGVDADIGALFQAALSLLERLGASLVEVRLPGPERHRPLFAAITGAEVLAVHEAHLERSPELYGEEVRRRIEGGRTVRAVDYFRALRDRETLAADTVAAFGEADLVALPAVPIPAPRIGEAEVRVAGEVEPTPQALTRHTRLFNLAHLPAASVPCGFTPAGLPAGLQLAGRPFDEVRVLQAAYAYEQESGWLHRRPPL